MADKLNLVRELEDDNALFPPADPAKYEEWFAEQVEVARQDAEDPNTVFLTHEEAMQQLEPLRREWAARAAQERDAA